jgi:hypothetical protein
MERAQKQPVEKHTLVIQFAFFLTNNQISKLDFLKSKLSSEVPKDLKLPGIVGKTGIFECTYAQIQKVKSTLQDDKDNSNSTDFKCRVLKMTIGRTIENEMNFPDNKYALYLKTIDDYTINANSTKLG